jgi:hypothetical protein
MAAIEFRSYFAGTSSIRATSPGLQDTTLTITITGAPVFVPGQTPPVADRPYHAFRNVTTTAMADGNLATDRPTQVSSEASDHSGRMANDGNAATFWSPVNNRPNPWWQLDLEQITALSKSKINFGSKSFCPYKIEISDDGSLWTLVADQPSPTGNEQIRTDSFPAGSHGRYVRITLTGVPAEASARISEVEVDGHVLTP